jgi:TonB family protein
MNLTMKRTDAGTMRRVAIKALCAILGFGTAVSALALRLKVGVPESQPVARQIAQANSSAPATMVLAVPRDGQATPPATMEVETTQALGSSDGSGAQRVKLSSPASIATIDIHPAIATDTNATPDQSQAGEPPAKIRADIMAGQTVSKVTPVYPSAAKVARIQGEVLLHAVIGKDGVVERLDVLSGPQELRASAIDAVRHWVYKPYLLNGNPTEVDTTITVHYNLSN